MISDLSQVVQLDELLLIEIVLVPFLVWGITYVEHRRGSTISGLIVGLPLTTGPVVFFLSIGYGVNFALASLTGVIISVTGAASFGVYYSLLSKRMGWIFCLITSWLLFALIAFLLDALVKDFFTGLLIALISLTIGVLLIKRSDEKLVSPRKMRNDTLARIISATFIVILVTASARFTGPVASGIISNTPIFLSIFGVFDQRMNGWRAVSNFVKGVLIALFSYAAFFLVLEVTLGRYSILLSFLAAIAVAVSIDSLSLIVVIRGKLLSKK